MNNKKKIFTRLDAQNNRIPGSSVERMQMPKTGKWVEDTPYNQCCFPYTELSVTPGDVTDDNFTLTILCDAVTVFTSVVKFDSPTTTIDEVVAGLNSQLGYLGSFSVDGSSIVLKLKTEVSDNYLCSGTLSFTVTTT